VLSIIGPLAAEILATASSISSAATLRGGRDRISIGYAPVRALRGDSFGTEGWDLLIPTEFAVHAFEILDETGRSHGLTPAGAYAQRAMRIESGEPAWPDDIDDSITPLEAGLADRIAWAKPEFIGRDALLRQREQGAPRRRLVHLLLAESAHHVHRQEPIFCDGKAIGAVTSGVRRHGADGSFALGLVSHPGGVSDAFLAKGRFEIEIAGERVAARVLLPSARAKQPEAALA
jgi:4-methylaminobutanoate oxidase (formaldehyde-forming)